MKLWGTIKEALGRLGNADELERLSRENEELRENERIAIAYVRRKVNQLLLVMGTLPLRQEELDDRTLLDLDPIGIVADSFAQILQHLTETNDKLRLANSEIQTILSAAGVGILVVDDKMRILAYNKKLREIFLRNNGEAIGKLCHEVLCDRHGAPEDCAFERVMTVRAGIHRSDWVHDGRHFDVAGAPIKNKYGDITHVVLVYNDITDHRRTEETLRKNGEMYRNLFDHSSDMIQSVNPDGTFNFVNRCWRETLGYRDAEIDRLTVLDIIHPDYREECGEKFANLLAGKKVGPISTVFVARDGTPVPVEGNLSIDFIDGRPTSTSCIFRRTACLPVPVISP